MGTITSLSVLNALAKKYNLEFDKKYKYYIGNAYTDSKGNYLQTYMYLDGNVFKLQYFDGCFNPYVVMLKSSDFGAVLKGAKVDNVVMANTPKLREHYQTKLGDNFTMLN